MGGSPRRRADSLRQTYAHAHLHSGGGVPSQHRGNRLNSPGRKRLRSEAGPPGARPRGAGKHLWNRFRPFLLGNLQAHDGFDTMKESEELKMANFIVFQVSDLSDFNKLDFFVNLV